MKDDIVSRVMREMGKKGGKAGGEKGGKSRMDSMTPTQRKTLAKKAAAARWDKKANKPAGSSFA